MAEPEEQRRSGSTITTATAEQAVVDGGVSVAAVDEMIKQQGTKHHRNTVKLEQHFARTKAHHRALATTALTRRWCCRPRGRKKGDEWRFPVKSSDQSWLARCARNKRSYEGLCCN